MGIFRGPNIVRNGLVLALDATDERSYVSGSTTWYDLSGNNNHATIIGNPIFSNNMVEWDGSSNYCVISNDSSGSLNFAAAQSLCFWIMRTDDPFSGRRNPWNQGYGGFGTITHEPAGGLNYYYGTGGNNSVPYTAYSSNNMTSNILEYRCIVRNIDTITWYKNGIFEKSTANIYGVDCGTTTNDIWIGRGYAGYYLGKMGCIFAYNRDIRADEILQNYNAQKGRFGL